MQFQYPLLLVRCVPYARQRLMMQAIDILCDELGYDTGVLQSRQCVVCRVRKSVADRRVSQVRTQPVVLRVMISGLRS